MLYVLLSSIFRPLKLKWNKWNGLLRFTGLLTVLLYCFLLLYSFFGRTTSSSYKRTKVTALPSPDAEGPIKPLDGGVGAHLYKMFKRADTIPDNRLSLNELTWIIGRSINSHLNRALKKNLAEFSSLDVLRQDGRVEWEEYFSAKLKDLDESKRESKEKIAEVKAAWSEAIRSSSEGLNIDEFLGFKHPELNHFGMSQAANDALQKYDSDGDKKISEKEFLNGPAEDGSSEVKRRSLFREDIDTDSDGYATNIEIIKYINPRSLHWSHSEASELMRLLDTNMDSHLDWKELNARPDIIAKSKLIKPEISLHDSLNWTL